MGEFKIEKLRNFTYDEEAEYFPMGPMLSGSDITPVSIFFLFFLLQIQEWPISTAPYEHHLKKIGDFDESPYKNHFQNLAIRCISFEKIWKTFFSRLLFF